MRHSCPNCGYEIDVSKASAESRGRDFAIVWLTHIGVQQKDIAKAFGVTSSVIHQQYAKISKAWAAKSGFYCAKKLKDGRMKLHWFYRNGKLFRINGGLEYERVAGGEWRWEKVHRPFTAKTECGEVITDLSDWKALGFCFE